MKSCWESKPDLRPSFSRLCQRLSYILEAYAEYLDFFTLSNSRASTHKVSMSTDMLLPSAMPPLKATPLSSDAAAANMSPHTILSSINDAIDSVPSANATLDHDDGALLSPGSATYIGLASPREASSPDAGPVTPHDVGTDSATPTSPNAVP